jgi:hypothetical protein
MGTLIAIHPTPPFSLRRIFGYIFFTAVSEGVDEAGLSDLRVAQNDGVNCRSARHGSGLSYL